MIAFLRDSLARPGLCRSKAISCRLLLAAAIAAAPALRAADAPSPSCGSFSVAIDLVAAQEPADNASACLTLTNENGTAALSLGFDAAGVRLDRLADGKREQLWKLDPDLSAARHSLLVKQRDYGTVVCLDGRQLATDPTRLAGRVSAAFIPGGGFRTEGDVRVQRTGAIHFTDGFARRADEGALWETVSGRFSLNTSRNPGSSQSAFHFWGSAPGGRGVALAENSYWFWDDYRVGISAKAAALPACLGLVFHHVGPQTYHALRWEQPVGSQGSIQLLRQSGGTAEIVAQAAMELRPEQWYRLCAVTHGSNVAAFVNGILLFRVEDPALTGGRVGLLVEGASDVYFDDALVTSATHDAASANTLSSPFGPCEQPWSDYGSKLFTRDRYMQNWAHPRSAWQTGPLPGDNGLFWFRSRLFSDVTFNWRREPSAPCHWPDRPIRIVLFGDRAGDKSGYRIELGQQQARLVRGGSVVTQCAFEDATLESLEAALGQGRITLRANDRRLLEWEDPAPLAGGEVAADMGPTRGQQFHSPDWRDAARVTSTHRLDYSFEHAPTAWEVQSGTWRGTHRWACVPRWSFFGGRGDPAGPHAGNGNAILWNRRLFEGDFDLEVFYAPMEGTPQRVHFAWPVSLNLAFAADGRNLDSGYMFLFGTYDTTSKLYCSGKEIAAWDARVDPALRYQALPWYHRVTQSWQHVRIQRRSGRIMIDAADHYAQGGYKPLERALDVEEPAQLAGKRIGLWTWGANGMALARATISFARSPGVAPPQPARGQSTGTDVATESLGGVEGAPDPFTRVRNLGSGGTWLHVVTNAPIDLAQKGVLEMDVRVPPDAELSLFASLRGQTAEVVVCGESRYRCATVPLGSVEPGPRPGEWQHVAFDFAAALRKAFPDGPLIIEQLHIGSPYDTLPVMAGLGVNRSGAYYDLANVRWLPSAAASRVARAPALELSVKGLRLLDDFESGMGEWRNMGGWDGATLYRDDREPAAGSFSLRLLNREVAGPAGAWVSRAAYDAADLPEIAFDYRFPAGVEVNLLVQANGEWFEVRATGTDASWPVIGTLRDFKADGSWHSVRFNLQAALAARLGAVPARVESLAWGDSRRMGTRQGTAYWVDNFCRVPAVGQEQPTVVELACDPEAGIAGYSHVIDGDPRTDPGTQETGKGAQIQVAGRLSEKFLHVRALTADGRWTEPKHLPLGPAGAGAARAAAPPPAPAGDATDAELPSPFISFVPSDRLCRSAFEWTDTPEFPEKAFDDVRVRREAWVLRCDDDAATGEGCVEFLNLDRHGFFSAFFRRSDWDLARWPRVGFDYKFQQPGCALHLSMLVNEAMTIVEWTGKNQPGNHFHEGVVGAAPRAIQDGRWRHLEFDLLDMVLQARFGGSDTYPPLTVSELATWATSPSGGGYVNPVGARLRIDNVCIYSPRGRSPALEWRVDAPERSVKGYSYVLDGTPDTQAPEQILTTDRRIAFDDVAPGVHYMHVRACGTDGRWGATGHCRFEIE